MKANTRRRFYNTAFRILFTLAVLAAAPVLTACSQKESAQNSVRDAGAETDASSEENTAQFHSRSRNTFSSCSVMVIAFHGYF